MKIKLKYVFILALLFVAQSAHAGFWDIFSSTPSNYIDSKSECGQQIDIFRKFMHDAKICKSNDDCVVMEGTCPLGCYFYINKNFVEIITTEMNKVKDVCSDAVCSSKCDKESLRSLCIQNKCQPVK